MTPRGCAAPPGLLTHADAGRQTPRSSAHSTAQKLYNWSTLNQKVRLHRAPVLAGRR